MIEGPVLCPAACEPHPPGTCTRRHSTPYEFGRRASFWVAAGVVAHTLWTSAAPAMTYPLFVAEWHLTHTVTTGIFAIYPIVVAAVLIGFGDGNVGLCRPSHRNLVGSRRVAGRHPAVCAGARCALAVCRARLHGHRRRSHGGPEIDRRHVVGIRWPGSGRSAPPPSQPSPKPSVSQRLCCSAAPSFNTLRCPPG